jgi:hypothetical protein
MAWDPTVDFETYAGSRLFIAPLRPSDNTEVLWEGLDWNEITITSVPPVDGRTYNNATVSIVSTGRDAEKKGTYTFGSSEFGVLWLPEQQGQIIARALSLSYDIGGFCLVSQGGDVRYWSGQVSTFTESGGSGNDARVGTLNILKQSEALLAATPVVPTEDVTP